MTKYLFTFTSASPDSALHESLVISAPSREEAIAKCRAIGNAKFRGEHHMSLFEKLKAAVKILVN